MQYGRIMRSLCFYGCYGAEMFEMRMYGVSEWSYERISDICQYNTIKENMDTLNVR